MNLLMKTMMLASALSAFGSFAQAQYPTGQQGPAGVSVSIQNGRLIVNNLVADSCVKSATIAYVFANNAYVFAVGCDSYPYAYNVNSRMLSLVTVSTQVRTIQYATVQNGYVTLSVIGTGGSTYGVRTSIYAGGYPPQPQPYPQPGSPVGHGYNGCTVMPGRNAAGQNFWNVLDRQGRFVGQYWSIADATTEAHTDLRCQ